MGAKAVEHFQFFAGVDLVPQFFQREVDDIVMMELFRLDQVAEAEPEAVEKIDFVGGEIRRMGAEDFKNFVASREMDFEIELRLGLAEALPGFTDLAGLLFALPFTGRAGDDGGRLKALAGAKNTVPQFVCSYDGEADRFAAFFGQA